MRATHTMALKRARPAVHEGYLIDPGLVPSQLLEPKERSPVPIRPPERKWGLQRMRLRLRLVAWLLKLVGVLILRRQPSQAMAQQLCDILGEFGGLLVKLGQLLSLRPDLFNNEFCEVLARLQFKAVGFSPELAKQIVREQLGRPIEDVFDIFEEKPIAAASIAQVHRARLRDQQVWVVVKVLRPDVARRFMDDLETIRGWVNVLRRMPGLQYFTWNEMLDELEGVMREEVDLRYEAANVRRMRKTLRRHRVYVPRVFKWSSRQILVIEFVPGVLMTDVIRMHTDDPGRLRRWMQENDVEPEKLGRRLFVTLQRQLFEDNLFHGDLHPGNILVLRGGRVALIDFGSVGSMDANYLQVFKGYTRAMGEGDFPAAADYLMLLTEGLPPIDTEAFKEEVTKPFRAWALKARMKELPYGEKSISGVALAASKIILRYRIVLSWQFMKVNRASATLDASLAVLLASADYGGLIRTYFMGAERRANRSFGKRVKRLVEEFQADKDYLTSLAELISYRGARLQEDTSSKVAVVGAFFFQILKVSVFLVLVGLVYRLMAQGISWGFMLLAIAAGVVLLVAHQIQSYLARPEYERTS